MDKPEYNLEALKAGLVNIDRNIDTLEAELELQRDRQAEFRSLIERHEKWNREQAGGS